MNEPKVELKNIVTFRGMEGYGVNAWIYINGVKCLFMRDAGDGGMIDYDLNPDKKIIDKVRANVQILDDYIKTLPAEEYEMGGKKYCHPINRDSYFNNKLIEIEKQKANKKIVKLFQNSIVIGKPNSDKYTYFKQKIDLKDFPKDVLQKFVNNVQNMYCKDGVVILNTNLQELGIKL